MKKWSEIKQATLDKLFLTQSEAEQIGYLSKFRFLANEGLNIIANRVKPRIAVFEITTDKNGDVVEMPDDFLSFADITGFVDEKPETDVVYVSDRLVAFPTKGKHKVFYNATWYYITEDDTKITAVTTEEKELPIDISVINCLPTYIASQILAQDDIQRSTVLKNEFELMLAGLDTNIMYGENHYRSIGGWY